MKLCIVNSPWAVARAAVETSLSPLATVREPAVAVVSCAKLTDAEKANRKTASTSEENILAFGIAISNSLLLLRCRAHTSELVTL